jgi:hypothetical protein
MPLMSRKTDEDKEAVADAKLEKEIAAAEDQRRKEIENAKKAFFASPAGQARLAYERGDEVFQYSANVMSQQAIIVAMVGSNVAQRTADPSVILNSVCNEGWELVNGSFVFVEMGQQSRDKFLSSGQNVAVKGATVGYYLFRRNAANRKETAREPWGSVDDPIEWWRCGSCSKLFANGATHCPHCGVEIADADPSDDS